jgi:predicted ATP-binding protein involved in virulence
MTNANFRIRNYLGINQLDFSFPLDSKWVVIQGENGSGKTSILKSIVRSLSSKYDCNFYDSSKGNNVDEDDNDTTFYSEDDSFSSCVKQPYFSAKNDINIGGESLENIPNIIAYGSEWSDHITPSSTHKYRSSATLFTTSSFLLNIEETVLSRWFNGNEYKKEHKNCVNLFKKIIPNLKDIQIDKDYTVLYYFNSKNKSEAKKYYQLPSSYRNLISKFGDMFIYLKKYSYENKKTIVFLDSFDLYLDDNMKKKLPKQLSEIFPNITFVATTIRDFNIKYFPNNSFYYQTEYNQDNGVTIIKNKDKQDDNKKIS